jgi:hypothetical protein
MGTRDVHSIQYVDYMDVNKPQKKTWLDFVVCVQI